MRERAGYLDRDGIRQGWIDAGRTPAEADLMMAVFDSAAESWAKQNGMYPDEFYSMAAQMKGIATWLPGTDGSALHQTAAEYAAQYHDIIMQHYGNENFRKWFGNSKVVDENGLPLVVHHGSPVTDIEVFDTENGTYFTADPDYAERYARTSGEIYDCYLCIEKPFDTRDPECRRIYQEEFYREYGGSGIMDSGLPDWNDGYDLVDFLKEKGYDYDGIYVDEGATRGGIS